MAQSGPSELPHPNFSTSYSQSSHGIPPPPAGLGFDHTHVHQVRFPPEIPHMHQFYLPIQNGGTANTSAAPQTRLNNDQSIDAGIHGVKDSGEHQRSPGMLNFSNGHSAPSMGLARFNSAPSSVLSRMTGMGNETFMNHEAELGRYFPGGGFSNMNRAHGRMSKVDEAVTSSAAENDPDRSRIVSSAYRFKSLAANGSPSGMELQPRIGVDIMAERMENPNSCFTMPSSEGTVEPVRPSPGFTSSSYPVRSTVMSSNVPLESGADAIHAPPRTGHGLFRHSSSPAGFLSHHVSTDEHDRLMVASSSGNSSEDGSYERQGTTYFTGYAWDESGNVMNGSSNAAFSAKKRMRNSDEKYYAGSVLIDSQKSDALEHGTYFSLGTSTSPESIYIADKLSSDTVVPCRARAKRGCATHPRSIAERVRRTKISDRMKKLQELIPNMDKQTNTAEMLDEAVEYVKNLQHQVQELTEARAKCKCTCKKKDG